MPGLLLGERDRDQTFMELEPWVSTRSALKGEQVGSRTKAYGQGANGYGNAVCIPLYAHKAVSTRGTNF